MGCFSLAIFSGALQANNNYIQEIAAASSIAKAISDNSLRPVPSVDWTAFDRRKAVNVQKRVVAIQLKKGQKIAGFKAGLTQAGSAEKFGLKAPVTGVLFKSAKIQELKVLSLNGAYRLMIEQELAFLLATDINKKIPDIASLKGHFSHISYALEFPDLGFSSRPNGLDIIANNVVNRYFHIGPWQTVPENINAIAVSLRCDNKTINQGRSGDVMGDQWQALLWMVNELLAQGYVLHKGQVLISGNLGQLLPAKLCRYSADFSELGHIEFTVTP